MGLFNFDFSTQPKGDLPRKKGIFLYLEIFFRKLFKLISLNVIYFLVSLPLIALFYIFIPAEQILNTFFDLGNTLTENEFSIFSLIIRFAGTVFLLAFFGSGPASAGLAYILRGFTREEPVWLWSEFFGKFKENFKQSLIVLIINIILIPLIYIAFMTYFNLYIKTGVGAYLILLYLMLILILMYVLMHTFIYQIMITYNCTIPMLYKNALLLSVAKFPICLLISLVSAFIIFALSFSGLEPLFVIFLFFVLFYVVVRFPLEFYAARTIEKLIKANSEGDNN